jgi:hypothetical protein
VARNAAEGASERDKGFYTSKGSTGANELARYKANRRLRGRPGMPCP